MAIDNNTVELEFLNVVADVEIPVDIKAFTTDEIYVYYCNAQVLAEFGTDYTVTLDEDADFETFIVTPTVVLIDKIDQYIIDHLGEQNIILVRRTLDYLSDFQQTDSFLRQKISREFDRTIMRMQQLALDFSRVTGIDSAATAAIAAAASAAASAAAATSALSQLEVARDEALAARDEIMSQDFTNKADKATTIAAGGLATGGGSLAANRTITVTEASQAEAEAGTDATKAMTPRRSVDVIKTRPLGVGMCGLLAATAIPTGMRVLKRNGALLSRTTYADLWAFAQGSNNLVSDATWSGGAFAAFSTGDGATTFRLMDDRGYFDRAYDDGRGVDTGRVITAPQADELKSHSHTAAGITTIFDLQFGPSGRSAPFSSSTGATGGTETRPKNNSKLAVIGY